MGALMNEAGIISTLINQAPGMATLVIVVVLFLRFMEKRDAMFVAQMKEVAEELTALRTKWESHDVWEREALNSIQEQQQNVITGKLKATRKQHT